MTNLLLFFTGIFLVFTFCDPGQTDVHEGLISIHDTQLYVKVIGDAEPVVFLHGGPGLSHDYFLPHLEPMTEELQLIFFDQRGMGRSSLDLDSTSFSIDLIVEDIDALRKELGHEKIHLLGHSWGGMLAMRYAIRYPDRLSSLILSNSIPASSEFTEATFEGFAKIQERQNMNDLQPLVYQINEGSQDTDLYERVLQLTYRPTFYDTAGVNRLHLNLQETYFQTQQLLSYLPPPTEPVNMLPELEQLTVPTLIIRAEMEPIPEASDIRIQQAISGARLITVPHSGHFPFIEQPEAYIDEVLRFVKNKGT